MRFNDQEDLRKFLEDLGELYVPYCAGLWDLGPVRSTEDLAVAPEADLKRCGVQSGIHIARIKAVASGVASSSGQAGLGGGAAADPYLSLMKEQLRQVLREELQPAELCKKAFSKVSEKEATRLLAALDIPEMDGNAMQPIIAPPDSHVCTAFDFSRYKDELEGNVHVMRHHQEQLQKLGVEFGKGGFAMYDLQDLGGLFQFNALDRIYSGNVDCGIAPFGLMPRTAAEYCCVMYEHKQTAAQKAAYVARQAAGAAGASGQATGAAGASGQASGVAGTSGQEADASSLTYSAGRKGQVVSAMIGALAYNNFPLILDLTDGQVHHMLQLRGAQLYVWTDLTPSQAYSWQAELLKSCTTLPLSRKRIESAPEETQAVIKRLCSCASNGAGGLLEQLESVIPSIADAQEKLKATFDIMLPWAAGGEAEMPDGVKAWYG